MKRPLALLALTIAGTIGVASAPQAAFSAEVADESSATIGYEENDATIANPQRGFYHHTETHYRADGSGYEPLDAATLSGYRDEGITQILRVFYLEKFTANPTLDAEWLALVQADYDTARAAGVSVISRFAYVQGGDFPYVAPYGDAPLAIVLSHIAQLGPILRENADVIPVVQNGLIGLWGEGYYTDYFVADPSNPGVVTAQDWANRSAVTEALLAELPADRGVQVRTMASKQHLLGVAPAAENAVTSDEAFTDSAIARIGHHNDCLLAAPDDWGTFLSDPIELDQQYLEADSLYVPVGGETCNVNPPRSEWPSASAELARYHYSYLNRDYNQDVLNTWGEAGITEAAQRLGYRFVLGNSTVTPKADGTTVVSITVRNDGWAAPYTPRTAALRLTGAAASATVAFDTNSDARRWLPGTTTTLTATVGASVTAGTYDLALALPSSDPGTSGDARFAIQTANVGTWDPAAGVNRLGQSITVGSAVGSSAVAASAPGATLAATGVGDASVLAAFLAALGLIVGSVLLRASTRRANR